jgi:tetratricopeptide (TPR) repeat protein
MGRVASIGAAVLLGMLLGSAPPATADESPAAKTDAKVTDEQAVQAELGRANGLWQSKDYNGALAIFNATVERYPESLAARLERGLFFEEITPIVVEADREKFRDLARDDFEEVGRRDPDSVAAGIGRDGLRRLAGKDTFAPASVTCSDTARKAFDEGEDQFGSRNFDAAIAHFAAATAACPESGLYWMVYADAYYLKRDYPRAKQLFERALEADPWNRQTYRFLGDTEMKLGNREAALRAFAGAVLSDPFYEAAWSGLRQVAVGTGRTWHRSFVNKPKVTQSREGAEKKVEITMPPAESDEEAARLAPWLAYATSKALFVDDELEAPSLRTLLQLEPTAPLPPMKTPLDVEKLALKVAMQSADELNAADPVWPLLRRADQAGHLADAIFLSLMDDDLVDAYHAYRNEHRESLMTYLLDVLAPRERQEGPAETTRKPAGAGVAEEK